MEANGYSIADLNQLRESIEKLDKFNQIEILKIFHRNRVVLNENKFGVHINLTEINEAILNELRIYVQYIRDQEIMLKKSELEKEEYKAIYFSHADSASAAAASDTSAHFARVL